MVKTLNLLHCEFRSHLPAQASRWHVEHAQADQRLRPAPPPPLLELAAGSTPICTRLALSFGLFFGIMHLTQGSGTTPHPRPFSRKGRGES